MTRYCFALVLSLLSGFTVATDSLPAVKTFEIGRLNVPLQTSDEVHWALRRPPGEGAEVPVAMVRTRTHRDYDGIGRRPRPLTRVHFFTDARLGLNESARKVHFSQDRRSVHCANVKRVLWTNELDPTQFCRFQTRREEIEDEDGEVIGEELILEIRVVFTDSDRS
jgi:hypothetical protein